MSAEFFFVMSFAIFESGWLLKQANFEFFSLVTYRKMAFQRIGFVPAKKIKLWRASKGPKILSGEAICPQHTISMLFAEKLYIFLNRGFWGVIKSFIKVLGVFLAPNGPNFKLTTFLYNNSFSFFIGVTNFNLNFVSETLFWWKLTFF